jgi:ATP-dependent Clp protease adaptor protein ClpS
MKKIYFNVEKSLESSNLTDENIGSGYSLVLYNDDYHTFDYVIDALMEICKMDEIQATQCTYLIHYKERCDVKNGSKEYLTPMRRALAQRDLKAVIE